MDEFISILVMYALLTIFFRFLVFHIRRIVKIIQRFNLRKVQAKERLLLELNNLSPVSCRPPCPIPCFDPCCSLTPPIPDYYIPFTHAEARDYLKIKNEAAVASHSIPKGI